MRRAHYGILRDNQHNFNHSTIRLLIAFAEYVRLVSESLKEHPLTDDEKFLISLLALNTDGAFNGFRRNQNYANVQSSGDVHVFLPMSSWLSVYRESNYNFV